MRKYTIIMVTIVFAIFSLGIASGEASAHDWRTAEGWSPWKVVTWNKAYTSVRHKHVDTGTVCQAIRRDGTIERTKLVSLNATNRDCVGDGRQG